MKAKLFAETLPFEVVEFDFNPEALTYARGTTSANAASASSSGPGATPSIFLKADPMTLSGIAYLVGDDVKDRVDQMFAWMKPGGGLLGALIGAAVSAITGGRINLAAKQPVLIFQWGTQLMRCVMTTVSAGFERFAPSGEPNRAKVTFTVKEEINIFGMLPTNPTSGGMPGRHRHVMSQSETIQSVTTAAYGKPGMWRGVAETNGIDDPFRVRSGDVIYLPNPNEIIGRGGKV